jgi:hypothetical protein
MEADPPITRPCPPVIGFQEAPPPLFPMQSTEAGLGSSNKSTPDGSSAHIYMDLDSVRDGRIFCWSSILKRTESESERHIYTQKETLSINPDTEVDNYNG